MIGRQIDRANLHVNGVWPEEVKPLGSQTPTTIIYHHHHHHHHQQLTIDNIDNLLDGMIGRQIDRVNLHVDRVWPEEVKPPPLSFTTIITLTNNSPSTTSTICLMA